MQLSDLFKREESFCTLCLRQPGLARLKRCTLEESFAYTNMLEVAATSPYLCSWCAAPLRSIARLRRRAQRVQTWLKAYYTSDELPVIGYRCAATGCRLFPAPGELKFPAEGGIPDRQRQLLIELQSLHEGDLKCTFGLPTTLAEPTITPTLPHEPFDIKSECCVVGVQLSDGSKEGTVAQILAVNRDNLKDILQTEIDLKVETLEDPLRATTYANGRTCQSDSSLLTAAGHWSSPEDESKDRLKTSCNITTQSPDELATEVSATTNDPSNTSDGIQSLAFDTTDSATETNNAQTIIVNIEKENKTPKELHVRPYMTPRGRPIAPVLVVSGVGRPPTTHTQKAQIINQIVCKRTAPKRRLPPERHEYSYPDDISHVKHEDDNIDHTSCTIATVQDAAKMRSMHAGGSIIRNAARISHDGDKTAQNSHTKSNMGQYSATNGQLWFNNSCLGPQSMDASQVGGAHLKSSTVHRNSRGDSNKLLMKLLALPMTLPKKELSSMDDVGHVKQKNGNIDHVSCTIATIQDAAIMRSLHSGASIIRDAARISHAGDIEDFIDTTAGNAEIPGQSSPKGDSFDENKPPLHHQHNVKPLPRDISEECAVCHKAVMRRFMRAHMRMHTYPSTANTHDDTKRNMSDECPLCHIVVMRQFMERHMRWHAPPLPTADTRNDTSSCARVELGVEVRGAAGGEEPPQFWCVPCEHRFATKQQLERHTSAVHDKTTPTSPCPVCSKPVTKWRWMRHLSTHQSKSKHPCPECPAVFRNGSALFYHVARVHSLKSRGRSVECAVCHEMMLPQHAASHARRHEPPGPSACRQCNKLFSNERKVKEHVRTVHANSPPARVKCEVCSRNVLQRRIKGHMAKHDHTERVSCPRCPVILKHSSLRDHMRRKHSGREDTLQPCFTCGKLVREHSMYAHQRTHDNAVGFECDVCGKTYRSCYTLKDHMQMHEAVASGQVFGCHDCGKEFLAKSRLRQHIKNLHLPVRMANCAECGLEVKQRWLQRHIREKHRKRPRNNVCEVCGKGFFSKATLATHLLVHTDERPHACDHCDARFKQRPALDTHRKLKHLKVPWKELVEQRRRRREARDAARKIAKQ